MHRTVLFLLFNLLVVAAHAQNMVQEADKFISLLDTAQHTKTVYPFDSDERYSFHYFPINDRKGLPLDEMTEAQKTAAFDLMKTSLSNSTIKKVKEIIDLENILKELEKRKPEDHFRDPGKYYLAIFGIPADSTIWGWRFEGHHVSFNFSASDNKLVSGTPGFLGANPAVVPGGPHKGQEVLKEEKTWAFSLLHHLNSGQLKKAIIDTAAPGEIITGINRKAMIEHPAGLKFPEMTKTQQQELLKLVSLYIHRYKKDFADNMLREIQHAGLDNLYFAWAGHTEPGIGKPHYYRIQGPTLIIEYDNTQNNANHVHTVVRDLLHDYGGDILLEHYHSGHHHD
ncbi:MAG: DUF3500 domain-containing protein [Chitinophagaceae bacterium]|nr:DUF3500 domain-containing protein [Chitinophagaceae bacterium]